MFVWVEGWHPLPFQYRFVGLRASISSLTDTCLRLDLTTYMYAITIGPSIVHAAPVMTKATQLAQFCSDLKMSEKEVTLFFNFKGTLFSDIF